MKSLWKTLTAVLCALALTVAAGLAIGVKPQAQAAEDTLALTTLDWEGTPKCGWTADGTGNVQVGVDIATGQAPVVHGKTYSDNVIGTHLPAANEPQDIVYDISAYTDTYDLFEVWVAEPDGGTNISRFSVLVDGVEKAWTLWNQNLVDEPVVLRAPIGGADTLTLRLQWGFTDFSFGQCVWLEPTLKKTDATAERVWASDDADFTSTATGWDSGLGTRVVADARANGAPIEYYANPSIPFEKGLGLHLLGTSYADYEKNKDNSASYVSLQWDIEGKNYALFNALAYIQVGYGAHFDVWIDGEEVYKSGWVKSIATHDSEGVWNAHAGHIINVEIPEGARTFEIRVIADTIFNDGLVELCNAAFYRSSDYLWSKAAVETRAEIWPFAASHGYDYDGSVLTVYDSETASRIPASRGLYGLVGSAYEFDLTDSTTNYFSAKVGVTGRFQSASLIFRARIDYEDGSHRIYSSDTVTYAHSNVDFAFAYRAEGATKLTLYAEGVAAESDHAWVDARLTEEIVVFFEVDDQTETYVLYEQGDKITPPDLTVRGYEVVWKKDGIAFDFTQATATASMTLVAERIPITYDVTVRVQRDNGAPEATELYAPMTHTYGTETVLPTEQVMTGYDFVGWYVDGVKVTALAAEQYADDVTLVARYALKKFEVTFIDGVSTEIVEVGYGELVTAPELVPVEGYTFGGWFTDEEGTQAYDLATPVKQELTLYARWDKIPEPAKGCGGIVGAGVGGLLTLCAAGALIALKRRK